MADRSIVVNLKANVRDFQAEMGKAAKSLDDVVKKSGDSAGAANTTMGRLAQSARLQSDAWSTAGGALAGMGAAITGVNVLVAKTGIEYNTLQQKSRAALTTLTGSAEAANAQMDRLDEFARTSPFSKSVFITAQQQMLGFGIEAQKVIPYLSAINETIAATGGNNNDLAEIVRIFSQISAAGKITATDLMQFGQRGVDAATLIGSQMGKTGAQIRADITDGTLDAGAALDALATGMQSRFEGASAGVKNTMEGAFDRLKAAWRDLSADMMSGAVGQEGGGWLVGLTNGTADLLRSFQALPDPIKNTVGALSGMTGVGALAGGAVLLAVPKYVELHKAFSDLSAISPKLSDGLGKVAKGAGLVLGAMAALAVADAVRGQFVGMTQDADDLAATLSAVEQGTLNIETAFQRVDGSALRGGGLSLTQGWIDELDSVESFTKAFLSRVEYGNQETGKLFGLLSTGATDAINHFKMLDDQLKQMDSAAAGDLFRQIEEGMRAAGASTEDIIAAFPEMASAARTALLEASDDTVSFSTDATTVLRVMRGELDLSTSSMDGTSGASRDLTESTKALNEVLKQQSEYANWALESLENYYNSVLGLSSASIAYEAALDSATAAIEENGRTHDIATEKGRANQTALDGIADAAFRVADEMAAAGESTEDIAAKAATARDEFITLATKMGYSGDEAKALADKYGLIPELVSTVLSQPGMELSQSETEALVGILNRVPPEIQTKIMTIADLSGYYDVDRALNSINGRTASAYVTMKRVGQAAIATGGFVGDVAAAYGLAGGGQLPRIRPSGYLAGPGTGTSDSINARLSTKEFVLNEAATAYYTPEFMYRLNSRSIDRDWLRALGFAGGGSPSVGPSSAAPVASMVSRSSSVVNIGQINVTTAATTADGILADVAREMPAFFAQKG